MNSDRNATDVVVIGLGAVGSATLYQLAKHGLRAIGIDRFAPPHDQGSSHGETRITRQAIGEGGAYVPFVLASNRIWRELEAATGETLYVDCGALVMASTGAGTSHHGKPDFVGSTRAAADIYGIPHEMLDAAAIRRRFPRFAVPDGVQAYFEPGGGYLRPERCIAAQLEMAARSGAEIRTGQTVTRLRQIGDAVEVDTADGTLSAARVVVAAGAWAGVLLGEPFASLLTIHRQVLHWFKTAPQAVGGAPSPVFIWMHGASDEDYLYGFPPMPGEDRVKVATEQYATATTAAEIERTVDPEESAAMFSAHVDGRLTGVSSDAVQTAACLYTVTPDRGFIIDRHPTQDRVTVVSACSGHGFKHSAGIGFAVAEEIATGTSPIDLAPFALKRFEGRLQT